MSKTLAAAARVDLARLFRRRPELAGASGHEVRIVDPQTGATLRTLREQDVGFTAVAFARDGRLLAAGGDDGTVVLWSL